MDSEQRERLGQACYEARRELLIDLHVDLPATWHQLPEWRRDVECSAAASVSKATMDAARAQLVDAAHLYPPEKPWEEVLDEVDRQCIDRRELAEALGLSPLATWGEAMEEVGRIVARVRKLEARVPPAPPPITDLEFARQTAPGLAWQDGRHDAWAELSTGRAIAGDGHVTVGSHWVYVVVGGYKLRRDLTRPLTVAEARHVLHGFGQRLARSTLDYRRAAGMAILVGMGERP